MRALLGAALALALAGGALAEAPETSPRPAPRGAAEAQAAVGPVQPRPRPWVPAVDLTLASAGAALAGQGAADRAGPAVVMPPQTVRPSLAEVAEARRPQPVERASASGSLVAPRPAPRILSAAPDPAAGPEADPGPDQRPRPRLVTLVRPANPARNVAVVQPATRLAILQSPRPTPRPENHQRRAVVLASGMIQTQPNPGAIIGRRGAVCGDPRITGQTMAPIAGRVQGCGVEDPVKITAVSGVTLSMAATIDCPTAIALADWVDETVKPTVGQHGGGVAGLNVMGHYSCRPRNNQRGARISEHGRGRAIDIGAVILANGAQISVLNHWRDERLGPLLKAMHRGACGTFGTVLGPQADRFHQNHFHLDTARYRSGSYCR
ncbi:MAG: extensin family protein [Rhodobacteraceae bacterium]|jgi:hypothetical protein|nr:extensin family protein [Paracoccaceae bacterium]